MNSCQGSFCKRVEECCRFHFLCLMRRKFLALPICLNALSTDLHSPPQSKPWNPNSASRASKIGCRISHIIKKASILEASAARLATNPQNRGKVVAWEKFQHCLQNRVPRVQVLLPLPSSREPANAYSSAFMGFFHAKTPDWTRSIDTGFPWQNPPNAPIFVIIPTAAVRYIIKKASANFGKRTVLYRVPRMVNRQKNRLWLSEVWQ